LETALTDEIQILKQLERINKKILKDVLTLNESDGFI